MSGRRIKERVLASLNNKHIDLVKGDGYFYFVYDDPENKIFETRSVYVNSITQLSDQQWLNEAHSLICKVDH